MEIVKKHALENAIKFGKADEGRILGKVLGENPELKKDIQNLRNTIKHIVLQVNALSKEEQENLLKTLNPEFFEEKEKNKDQNKKLKDLKNVREEMVMRFEPSPSGPLHLGHSYVLCLNYAYAKKYNARLILRIADTNASNIYEPAYELIPRDAKWLTDNYIKDDDIIVQSDRMELYYDFALQFLEKDAAYICTCNSDDFKETITKKLPCPCRNNNLEENKNRWKKMFTVFQQGDAVMRAKTDVTHKNPALRDFPLFRINEEEHPRHQNKYRVWPLMNFAVTCDDHDLGITHILRAKDHADNAKRQEMMYKKMNWDVPETEFVGKINFQDMNLSTSKTRIKIDEDEFEGWDDIRLAFLPALRRRGYQPETFLNYALGVGLTLNDKTTSKNELFKLLDSLNKENIEETSYRYFFLQNPKKLKVEGAPELSVELDLHPDFKKGGRKFNCHEEFFISEKLNEGTYRLMDCINFTFENGKAKYHSTKYDDVKEMKPTLIDWLPKSENTVEVEVKMPDNTSVSGIGEHLLNNLKEGDIVQFVRFGFCRYDHNVGEKLVFWFIHK